MEMDNTFLLEVNPPSTKGLSLSLSLSLSLYIYIYTHNIKLSLYNYISHLLVERMIFIH
jgi:hypothetical protein